MNDYRDFLKYGIGEVVKENLLVKIDYIIELMGKLSFEIDELEISDDQYKELDHLLTHINIEIDRLKDEI
ncbi:hypothetical protein [Bacillus smithii]|uniref:hypothetical protein n=1 Tax=Bacillus smithii TaxID=1479 RepID=UPI003D1F5FD8